MGAIIISVIIAYSVFLFCLFKYCIFDGKEYKYKREDLYKVKRTLKSTYIEGIEGTKVTRNLFVYCPSGTEHYEVIRRIYDYRTDKGYLVVKNLGSTKELYDVFLVDIDQSSGIPKDDSISYNAYCNYLVFESKENIDEFIKIYLND